MDGVAGPNARGRGVGARRIIGEMARVWQNSFSKLSLDSTGGRPTSGLAWLFGCAVEGVLAKPDAIEDDSPWQMERADNCKEATIAVAFSMARSRDLTTSRTGPPRLASHSSCVAPKSACGGSTKRFDRLRTGVRHTTGVEDPALSRTVEELPCNFLTGDVGSGLLSGRHFGDPGDCSRLSGSLPCRRVQRPPELA